MPCSPGDYTAGLPGLSAAALTSRCWRGALLRGRVHSDLGGVSPHRRTGSLPGLQVIQGARVPDGMHAHSGIGCSLGQGAGLRCSSACIGWHVKL